MIIRKVFLQKKNNPKHHQILEAALGLYADYSMADAAR